MDQLLASLHQLVAEVKEVIVKSNGGRPSEVLVLYRTETFREGECFQLFWRKVKLKGLVM